MEYTKFKTGTFSAEVAVRDLRNALKGKEINEYEHIIRGLCLEDSEPVYGKVYDTKDAAMVDLEPKCKAYMMQGNASSYYLLEATFVEEYVVDEDGDFLYGSTYWSDSVMTDEELQELGEKLF